MELIPVTDTSGEPSPRHYEQLEAGNILFFPQSPTPLSEEDCQFLLSQRQAEGAYYKNIAYRPSDDTVTGTARGGERQKLHQILKNYCFEACQFVARLLPRYAVRWRLDFTSFRPLEEEGRNLSLHSRNDLLHVDAFPTRPTHGDRILRFFTNLNRSKPRIWITTENFEALARRFADDARLRGGAHRYNSAWRRALGRIAETIGLRQFAASPYDNLMRHFHNFLKENREFQESCPKERVEFPPRSSWLVFTDMVSHAVLSGQFALEQTLIVPWRAQLKPELSPLNVLERLTGTSLTRQD